MDWWQLAIFGIMAISQRYTIQNRARVIFTRQVNSSLFRSQFMEFGDGLSEASGKSWLNALQGSAVGSANSSQF